DEAAVTGIKGFDFKDVPQWDGRNPYVAVNNNNPFFTEKELENSRSYEKYGNLDSLGRCTSCIACIGKDLMPSKTRGYISDVRPTGWHTVKYKGIDGNYLYNRCHLIGYQLTGENANEKNLITGTRYLNIDGMLPFENAVAEYVKSGTDVHVLYRVTPVFTGNDLLARGVLMEGRSIEDNGKGINFCVFCYNVQPNVTIDYADGSSTGPEYTGSGN
ncbi:MAG: DNA/RNA non-specific endonuclease, partial [Candidatus Weimeria sp.]